MRFETQSDSGKMSLVCLSRAKLVVPHLQLINVVKGGGSRHAHCLQ